ncbi:MAG: LuxR C-terminal-related transcriptional regulator [Anaerovoracaceae bacterium]|jgi:LuxR family maltose regulon positive regulatory protein
MLGRDKRSKIDTDKIYIPEKLKKKLEKITGYPMTSIEAPIGYGKSVSCLNYLRKSGILYAWQDLQTPDLDIVFRQFCRTISIIDEECSDKMKELYPVTSHAENMNKVAEILSQLKLEKDVIVVIDNFQMISSEETCHFFEAIARMRIPNLHIVLIGRERFRTNREELRLKHLLNVIDVFDLMFDQSDISKYYRSCGVELSSGMAEKLSRKTDGWIAALYLALIHYDEMGSDLEIPEQIMEIFRQTVCVDYTEDQEDFLERICIFDDFSMEQARFVRRKNDPEQILLDLFESGDFIWMDPETGYYHIQRLFSKYFKEKMKARGLKFQNEVYRHAADWYFLNNKYGRASYFYYRSGNFEDMLKAFERDRGICLSAWDIDAMKAVFRECPEKIRNRHYIAIFIYARQLLMHSDMKELKSVMTLLDSDEYRAQIPEKERDNFAGEYQMLCSYLYHRDLDAVDGYQKRCVRKLRHTVAQTGRLSMYTFGVPSVLFLYYTKSGSLDDLLKKYTDTRDLYYRLTDNNGRGSEYLFEAEIVFNRGEIDRADILSYKAGTVAEKYGQSMIGITAWFLQAKIALLRGETEKGLKYLEKINQLIHDTGKRSLRYVGDICEASVYAAFNQLDHAAEWICSGDFRNYGRHMLYKPAIAYTSIIYSKILIDNFEYSKYLGLADELVEDAEKNHNVIEQIYHEIYKAVSFRRLSMMEAAVKSIHKAVSLAMKDRIYMPFVENGRELAELYRKLRMTDEEFQFTEKCAAIYRKHEKHMNVLLYVNSDSALSMLTRREQEISMLVAEGKTNLEIAKELSIAEITVKKCLSNVYSRLGVPNRASLIKKIIQ